MISAAEARYITKDKVDVLLEGFTDMIISRAMIGESLITPIISSDVDLPDLIDRLKKLGYTVKSNLNGIHTYVSLEISW